VAAAGALSNPAVSNCCTSGLCPEQNPLCSRDPAGSVQGRATAPEAGTQDQRSPQTLQTVAVMAGSASVR